MKTAILALFGATLALAPTAQADGVAREKILKLFNEGRRPEASEIQGAWVGRCYDTQEHLSSRADGTMGAILIGSRAGDEGGPLLNDAAALKFWTWVHELPRGYDNFPAKDFFNGKEVNGLNGSSEDSWTVRISDLFSDNCNTYGGLYQISGACLRKPARTGDRGWVQEYYRTKPNTFAASSEYWSLEYHFHDKTLEVRKNGKYLVSVRGGNYDRYEVRSRFNFRSILKPTHNHRTYSKRGKVIERGFKTEQVCYYFKRLD